jgi:hypothetical protein
MQANEKIKELHSLLLEILRKDLEEKERRKLQAQEEKERRKFAAEVLLGTKDGYKKFQESDAMKALEIKSGALNNQLTQP